MFLFFDQQFLILFLLVFIPFLIFSVNYNIPLKVFSSSNICGSFHLRQHDSRVGNDTLFRRAHDRIYINGRGNRFDTGMHLLAEQIAAAGVHRLGILTTIRSKKDRSFLMNFSGCDSGLFNPFDFFQLQAPLADQAVEQGAEQVRCGVHRHRMKLALLNLLFQASGSLKKTIVRWSFEQDQFQNRWRTRKIQIYF